MYIAGSCIPRPQPVPQRRLLSPNTAVPSGSRASQACQDRSPSLCQPFSDEPPLTRPDRHDFRKILRSPPPASAVVEYVTSTLDMCSGHLGRVHHVSLRCKAKSSRGVVAKPVRRRPVPGPSCRQPARAIPRTTSRTPTSSPDLAGTTPTRPRRQGSRRTKSRPDPPPWPWRRGTRAVPAPQRCHRCRAIRRKPAESARRRPLGGGARCSRSEHRSSLVLDDEGSGAPSKHLVRGTAWGTVRRVPAHWVERTDRQCATRYARPAPFAIRRACARTGTCRTRLEHRGRPVPAIRDASPSADGPAHDRGDRSRLR